MRLFFLLLFFPVFAHSQILHEENGVIIYTDVIHVDSSITKSELFNRAKAWIAMEYKSANAVIQMEDKDAGILIGKGIFTVQWSTTLVKNLVTKVPHTIKLLFKDGKYKYEITDLSYLDDYGNSINLETEPTGFGKKTKEKFLFAVNDEIMSTINSLENAMSKPMAAEDF
jgi:hypothetical protein